MQWINHRHDYVKNGIKKHMIYKTLNNTKLYMHELILQKGIALEIRENESLWDLTNCRITQKKKKFQSFFNVKGKSAEILAVSSIYRGDICLKNKLKLFWKSTNTSWVRFIPKKLIWWVLNWRRKKKKSNEPGHIANRHYWSADRHSL